MTTKVCYDEMLPHELNERVARFPVAYVPFGSLEWHDRHLPLGNDSLKAHQLLVLTAEKYGGVVVPTTHWGIVNRRGRDWTFFDFGQDLVDRLYTLVFQALVDVGFRVVIGVTGHDVDPQRAAIEKAVVAIQATGKATGFAMMEGELCTLPEAQMDHAGRWETSLLMYLCPSLVDMSRIPSEDALTENGQSAVSGAEEDARRHASPALGEKIATAIVDAIGHKAQELLASLGEVAC